MRPPDLRGVQLQAYLERWAAASSWTVVGEAFHANSLSLQLQESFYRGFNDRVASATQDQLAAREPAQDAEPPTPAV